MSDTIDPTMPTAQTLAPPAESRPPKVRTKPGTSLFEPAIVRRAVIAS